MKVLIENKRIWLGEQHLEYYPYYFDIWRDISDHRLTVNTVLTQWATALSSLKINESAVYLPYSLDDETCKYLKAELDGDDVVLTDMLVRAEGYAMDLDNLSNEMYSEPSVIVNSADGYSSPRFFGRYETRGLIEALRNARIDDA